MNGMQAIIYPVNISRIAFPWQRYKVVKIATGRRTFMPMGMHIQLRNPRARHLDTVGEETDVSTVKPINTTGKHRHINCARTRAIRVADGILNPSWDRTPGERQKGRAPLVHQQLFASLKVSEQVRCRLFTFGRIYMDAKDTDAFEFAWDRIHEAFFAATGKQLAFKAWDPEGWLVTISGDMESAPWIGMARSFIKRMDTANRPTVNEFLMKVLRVCRRHAIEGLKKAVKPHVDEDQWKRFEGFVSLKTPQDVQEFSDWVFSLNIATISAWWNHKLNHKWILPGLLECLSGLSHEDWLTTPFTSNGNETQHHWTNSQTGIGFNARECILRAAKADRAVGEQFKASLESGVMTNSRNELSHRTARNTKRHTSAIQKAQQAHTGQKKIAELRAQLAIAVAEAKTSSSGVVRVTQRSKTKSLVASAHIKGSASTRPKRPEKTAVIQDELEGIEMMTAPEEPTLFWDGQIARSVAALFRKPRTPREEKSVLVVVAKVAKNEWKASTRCGPRERKEMGGEVRTALSDGRLLSGGGWTRRN
ncbi:hypothetical protein B0H10DRAFT_2323670 [Mycena sp. CBHHK59/15]|nr:hypothetical protein B0H10DRAFT_2323670 [Mycena sp. CBHHK59/15]